MAVSAFIFEGTDLNFDQLVLENSRKGLVMVDFWAPWVGPSLRQREMLSQLATSYNGRFLLVTVNTDEQKATAGRFAVKSLPALKLFRGGKVVETLHGVQPERDYQAAVDRYLVALGDKVRLAAGKAWNDGDHDLAIQVLAEGAMAEPENLEIPAMLGKLLIRLSRFEEARSVLAALPEEARASVQISPLLAHLDFITSAGAVEDAEALQQALAADPDNNRKRFQLAAVSLIEDDYDVAVDALMEILRRDRNFDDGAARRGLLTVFDTLGGEHPLVRHYRGELARLIH
ncbi:MAG: tetratricopeptide repeat protein [Gammaproteobacteria bacterium]|nr:tetratricopeptide repeat protein [Gammaproteobacteria bacterium]